MIHGKLFILLFVANLIMLSACYQERVKKNPSDEIKWVHLESGEKKLLEGYEFYLKGGTGYNLYVRRSSQEPFKFISKEARQFADIGISPDRKLLLINAPCSVKTWCVSVAGIPAGRSRIISGEAQRSFKKDVLSSDSIQPGTAVSVYPIGDSFSPDKTRVLLKIYLVISPSDSKLKRENLTVLKNFKPKYYVVDTMSGNILKEYRSGELTGEWWLLGQDPVPRSY